MSHPDSGNLDKLRRLLALEKERRGVAQTEVIFINSATIAKQSAARAGSNEYIDKARSNELGFFNDYRRLRIDYARQLGLVDALPTNPMEYLLVGEVITYEQVEAANPLPDTLNSERLSEERLLTLRDRFIGRARSLPSYTQGDLAYEVFAEEYSAFKWYFPWEGRVVIGVPDGLTKGSVYEFKSTMKPLYKPERAKQGTIV